MGIIDTHCHLDFSQFEGKLDDILASCVVSGVSGFVVPSVKCSAWDRLLQMSKEKGALVKIALGLHPYFIASHRQSDLVQLESLLCSRASSCVAVGEIGLDATVSNYELQEYFFERQLELAFAFSMPVIVHSRKTHSAVYKKIKQARVSSGVVHAFSGSRQEADSLISLGLSLGVGPVITWPRASKTRDVLASVSLECLVLETDAPDMPVFNRARGCGSPLDVLEVFAALCEIRAEQPETIANQLLKNSAKLFGCAEWLKNEI